MVERILGSNAVGKGSLDVTIECLWASVDWWHSFVQSNGRRLWNDKVVLQLSLDNGEVLGGALNIFVDTEVWNVVILWWAWDWLAKVWSPSVFEFHLGILGVSKGGLNVLILSEVWHNVIFWVSLLVLILEVSEEAVTGLLGGGAGWVVHDHHLSHWGAMMVMVTHVDG